VIDDHGDTHAVDEAEVELGADGGGDCWIGVYTVRYVVLEGGGVD
jgi:hypothetical protein